MNIPDLEPRTWRSFQEAWHGPAPAGTSRPPALPDEAVDRLALALHASGLLAAADLRRARWLAAPCAPPLLLLLLLARLRRGQGSVREASLLSDLASAPEAALGAALPDPLPALLSRTLASDLPLLELALERGLEAAAAAGVEHPLVRVDASPQGRVASFARAREDQSRLLDGIRRRLAESAARGWDAALPDLPTLRRLHPLQRRAVEKALRHRTLVVAGGPGTGKTSVAAGILSALAATDPSWKPDSVMLCAPTGRAKARLAESLRAQIEGPQPPSRTLHSLLGQRPDGSCRHDASHPLPWACVVVDEASMVDQALFSALVDALHPSSRLVLLGDPEQLPSVEAGAVFGDLVAHLESLDPSREVPFVRLTHTWRAGGAILDLSREVNAGQAVLARDLASRALEPGTLDGSAETPGTVRWVRGDLPAVLDAWWRRHRGDESSASHQILCALHGGRHGREAINALGARWQRETHRGAAGSPAILTRNLSSLDLWNGDLGTLRERDGRLWVEFPHEAGVRAHPVEALEGLEPAWAITVHKSQGSEFDHVLLVLPERDTPLLTRQILYTALTRAKRSLWIWGDPALWETGVRRREDRGSPLFRI